ncbi:hypothetical protein ACFWBG_31620 [Nocardia salmonicida]|uniref:hypothetical protein n=1 Tax=Nocardia salmonicida TaxID=53431 RepID=UPI003670F469
MAADENGPGGSLWTDLPKAAGNGLLLLEPGAAQRAAGHVETMLELVVGAQDWIHQNVGVASPPVAASVSGQLMWTIFNVKFGTQLLDRVNSHRDILTVMGETFVAAGQKYQRTEHDSEVSFDEISFDDPKGTLPTGVPPVLTVPTAPTAPAPGTEYDAFSFGPELGAQLSWETLWVVCNGIDAPAVAAAASVWSWLATHLDTGFTTLRTSINSVSNEWKGAGSERAIAATNNYVTVSQQLTTDMRLMSDALLFTSGWLQQTKTNAMPPTPQPPPGTSITAQMLNSVNLTRYQENFQTYYSNNYVTTTTRIVKLPVPTAINPPPIESNDPPEDLPSNETHEEDGNETSSGGGGGTSPGSGREDTPISQPHSGDGDVPSGNQSPVTGERPGEGASPETTTPESTPSLSELLNQEMNPLNTLATTETETPIGTPLLTNAMLPPSGGAPILRGGGSGGLRGGVVPKLGTIEPKLFPRVAAIPEERFVGRAGPAGGFGSGMPFGGVPGRAGNGDEREKKREEYLNSTEHLDEALGVPERSVRPVLDR